MVLLVSDHGRDCLLALANLWEITADTYLLVANNDKKQDNQQGGMNQQRVINNKYIVNTKKGTIREAAFNFIDTKDDSCWDEQMTECLNLGDVSVFQKRGGRNETFVTPVYYVDNLNQAIVDQHPWQKTYQGTQCVPGFAKNMVIDSFYDSYNGKQIDVTTRRLDI